MTVTMSCQCVCSLECAARGSSSKVASVPRSCLLACLKFVKSLVWVLGTFHSLLDCLVNYCLIVR